VVGGEEEGRHYKTHNGCCEAERLGIAVNLRRGVTLLITGIQLHNGEEKLMWYHLMSLIIWPRADTSVEPKIG
jgi:hypothetical protein